MKKRTKISLVLSSAAAILLAGSIMAGGTYALFTSESKTNIAVTSGKVDVTAEIINKQTYSGVNLTGDPTTDVVEATTTNGTFTNGGTATVDGTDLKLVHMTPGDKVKFSIEVTNNSNVAAKYRTVVTKGSDTGLFAGLEIKVGADNFLGTSLISSYKDLGEKGSTFTIDVEVNLPSDRGNVYQGKECNLSFAVEAVQGNTFDGVYEVNSNNIQDYLDGMYGSLDGATLVLTEETGNTYNKLEFGRATKYAGSNTQYYIGGISEDKEKTLDEFLEIKNGSSWSDSSYYVRNINNLTIKAKEGVDIKVAGLNAVGGHQHSTAPETVHDYVLDKDMTGSAYYLAQNWSNITFEDISFTSGVIISSSQAETSIDGVTFRNCSFNPNGKTINNNDHNGVTFYSEGNTGGLNNLVVDNCSFENCFTAVYCMHVKGVTVVNSTFKEIGFNSLQLATQSVTNLGTIKFVNNTITNESDRILRFGDCGSDTQFIIARNTASNAYDPTDKSVIKATNLAEGITYDIHDNNWGEGTIVKNSEFEDK